MYPAARGNDTKPIRYYSGRLRPRARWAASGADLGELRTRWHGARPPPGARRLPRFCGREIAAAPAWTASAASSARTTPLITIGKRVIDCSQATSSQDKLGSIMAANVAASSDPSCIPARCRDASAGRLGAHSPLGSAKELRTSRSRCPSTGASTVSSIAEHPAASTRSTRAAVAARSL